MFYLSKLSDYINRIINDQEKQKIFHIVIFR
jgi:hypothetical protein